MKAALIDADSMIYVLAWQFRDYLTMPADEMQDVLDIFIEGILMSVNATDYIGAFGHEEKGFRYRIAKHAPYKAGRKELDPNVDRWRRVARTHFRQKWNFASSPDLEADDIISLAAEDCTKTGVPYVVCSPDKDLNQIPGEHFDYKKQDFSDIDQKLADYYFWTQMLVGDQTDNIVGIKGIGPKKAYERLYPVWEDALKLEGAVRREYLEYFGDHYGMLIFEETFALLSLMTSRHPYFEDHYWMLVNVQAVPERVN